MDETLNFFNEQIARIRKRADEAKRRAQIKKEQEDDAAEFTIACEQWKVQWQETREQRRIFIEDSYDVMVANLFYILGLAMEVESIFVDSRRSPRIGGRTSAKCSFNNIMFQEYGQYHVYYE